MAYIMCSAGFYLRQTINHSLGVNNLHSKQDKIDIVEAYECLNLVSLMPLFCDT